MRRDFGSDLFDLIDAKMTQRNVLALYVATAVAIDKWEPRFRLRRASIDKLSPDGVVRLVLVGDYYPRGHLGDYSVVDNGRDFIVAIGEGA